jgi:hypothetical protein
MARRVARGRYPGLKASQFGLPGKGNGKTKGAYPVNTRGRATSAKARAKHALGRGRITLAQYNQITTKANRKLYGQKHAPAGRTGGPRTKGGKAIKGK